ncbi:MAG TPA: hypothetical protein VFF39_15985, partial [Verrucomicrobiae bacterium]|nr:hypothetical protein [Verrucomicrobiae bacterium]
YIISSGQRYSPVQATALAALTANGDYYDLGYIGSFAGIDTARSFIGNLNAPATSVGIYAADACNLVGDPGSCSAPANQLISLTQLNKNGNVVNVSPQQVRFIINASESQSIFGTPFGNAPRNPVTDDMQKIGNVSIFKNIKLGEHVNFEFHTTLLNVFNQSNFSSVDAVLEDAGFNGAFNGFGDPTQTPSVTTTAPPTRKIIFGGKLTF